LQWPTLPRHHVFRNRGLGNIDAELEQLTMDLGRSPRKHMISIYTQIAFCSWPVLFVAWFIGYINTKKTLRRPEIGRYLVTTILLVVSYSLLFGTHYPNLFGTHYPKALGTSLTPQNGFLGIIGDIVCVCGILFAIWARITLGSNWSGTVATLKEDHELIQRGPYAIVRHPIYTGFFFAMIGTALTIGTLASYAGAIVGLLAFLIRIPTEERLMTEQFPESYGEYKERVRALVPFVW
jgi:protein-S-isoprenylcysteine O-methyltransferase Ste14